MVITAFRLIIWIFWIWLCILQAMISNAIAFCWWTMSMVNSLQISTTICQCFHKHFCLVGSIQFTSKKTLSNASKPTDAKLSSPSRPFLCDAEQLFKMFLNVLSDGRPVLCVYPSLVQALIGSDSIRNVGFSTTKKFSRVGGTCNILHNCTM